MPLVEQPYQCHFLVYRKKDANEEALDADDQHEETVEDGTLLAYLQYEIMAYS